MGHSCRVAKLVRRHALDVEILGSSPSPAADYKLTHVKNMEEQTQQVREKKSGSKKIIVGVIVLLALAGAGYWAVTSGTLNLNSLSVGSSEKFVATVNGEQIEQRLFEARLQQAQSNYEAQGIVFDETTIEQLKQQVLDDIIAERLLVQHAKERGIQVEDQEVEEQYQLVLTQFGGEQELKNQLEAQNTTVEDVKTQIKEQLIIQGFADQYATEQDIEVLPEEIQQTYDDAVAQGEELPPFEELQGQIEDYLRQQKVGQLIDDLLIQLREQAVIEIPA